MYSDGSDLQDDETQGESFPFFSFFSYYYFAVTLLLEEK